MRALLNDVGENVKGGSSVPVEVLGFDSAPEAGDQFAVVENEARARAITDYRMRERRERLAVAGARGSLEQMMNQLKEAASRSFHRRQRRRAGFRRGDHDSAQQGRQRRGQGAHHSLWCGRHYRVRRVACRDFGRSGARLQRARQRAARKWPSAKASRSVTTR